jgi:hypothetical protein
MRGEDIVHRIRKCVIIINIGFYFKVGKSNNFRKPSLNSNLFLNNLRKDKNVLGSYLAGLIEGGRSIIVPKTVRNQKALRALGALGCGAGKFWVSYYINKIEPIIY